MSLNRPNNKGFTFIEMVIVASIIGLVAANRVVPQYLRHVEKARENICLENRRVVEQAEQQYMMEKGEGARSMKDLVDAGYLEAVPSCPSGGIYTWMGYAPEHSLYHQMMVCSVHGVKHAGKTVLGSDFGEITGGFRSLLKAYYDAHGRYPKGNWKKVLTALGLDRNDWIDPVDGIKYRPYSKGRLLTQVSNKYRLSVELLSGETVAPKKGGKLWYSMGTGKWYYKKIKSGQEADIDTLVVEKR